MLFGLLWAVWLVFGLIDRRNQTRAEQRDDEAETGAQQSVELTECDQCGAFVPAGGCAKSDCPLNS